MEWLSCNCTETCFFLFILKVNSLWKLQWKFSLLYNGKGDANEMEDTSQSVVFLASVLWLVCTRLESFMESGFYCERIKNQVNLVLWHRKSLKIEKIAKNWHLLKWTWEILTFLCLLRKKANISYTWNLYLIIVFHVTLRITFRIDILLRILLTFQANHYHLMCANDQAPWLITQ